MCQHYFCIPKNAKMAVHEVAIDNKLRVGKTVCFYACAANDRQFMHSQFKKI